MKIYNFLNYLYWTPIIRRIHFCKNHQAQVKDLRFALTKIRYSYVKKMQIFLCEDFLSHCFQKYPHLIEIFCGKHWFFFRNTLHSTDNLFIGRLSNSTSDCRKLLDDFFYTCLIFDHLDYSSDLSLDSTKTIWYTFFLKRIFDFHNSNGVRK